jgi:hypothetical protein
LLVASRSHKRNIVYIARLTIPTDPIGATRRQVLEHSARRRRLRDPEDHYST